METNTPHYYSECVRVLGPLMEQGLEKAKAAAIFISENTTQLILWVKEKTPLVIEWVRLYIHVFSHKNHNESKRLKGLNSHMFCHCDCCFPTCLCPGEHQHSRQCIPDVGIPEGAAPPPPPELHPASAGVHVWPATASVDQPSGLLQVSTLRHPFTWL